MNEGLQAELFFFLSFCYFPEFTVVCRALYCTSYRCVPPAFAVALVSSTCPWLASCVFSPCVFPLSGFSLSVFAACVSSVFLSVFPVFYWFVLSFLYFWGYYFFLSASVCFSRFVTCQVFIARIQFCLLKPAFCFVFQPACCLAFGSSCQILTPWFDDRLKLDKWTCTGDHPDRIDKDRLCNLMREAAEMQRNQLKVTESKKAVFSFLDKDSVEAELLRYD